MITVKQVAFQDIEKEWRTLEDEGDVPTIFQTFDWMETWWKNFGFRGKCLLLAVFKNNELIGIAPLYTTRMIIRGFPMFKMVLPIGAGESDYNGVILKRAKEHDALVSIFEFLKGVQWDILKIGDVHGESPTETFIGACSKSVGFHSKKKEHMACPCVVLPSEPEEYLATLATHLKKNIRGRTKKLHELGDVRFTVAPRDIAIPEAMRSFFLLHENRWGDQGQKGALAGERLKDMHAEAAQRLARYLHIGFLEINGKRIACQYGYTFNNTRYSYLRGWDPDYKKMGVANILLLHLIEESIKAKVKEYDFMRGDEEYKLDFTSTKRISNEYLFSKSKLKLHLMLAFEIISHIARHKNQKNNINK